MSDDLRDEIARIVRELSKPTAEQIADALLASPVLASLKADAWELGYHAGHVHARARRL